MEENKSEDKKERTPLENLLYYISYLLRHRFLIISVTLVFALGSVAFSVISIKMPPDESPLPNRYRSYSVLIISERSGNDISTMLTALGISTPMGGEDMDYGQLGLRVLRSRPFIDEIVKKHNIIQRYKIQEYARTVSREIVLNSSDVQYDPRTGTLIIAYEATDPVFARDIVESMVEGLKEWFTEWVGTSSKQQLLAMERKILEVSNEISRLEEEIRRFQVKYGVFSVEQLAEAQMAMITDLESQLIETEVALRNYSDFATIEDQELIQLQARRDGIRDLIQQIEQGKGSGVRDMPSREELPTLAIEYSHLRMSHEIQMRIYKNLKEQYEVQKLTSSGSSIFSVLEPAEIPEEKSSPQRSRICIFSTLFGFVLSIFIALIIDLVRNIKNDPDKRRILKENISR